VAQLGFRFRAERPTRTYDFPRAVENQFQFGGTERSSRRAMGAHVTLDRSHKITPKPSIWFAGRGKAKLRDLNARSAPDGSLAYGRALIGIVEIDLCAR